jgi:hypothetical protein
MSIERDGRRFLLICDECGEQHTALDFEEAVTYKREFGWRSVKDGPGGWVDLCPDCAAGVGRPITDNSEQITDNR